MDTNHNSSEEAEQVKAGMETLRSELSYAKTYNSEWFEAFLKRIDETNDQIKSLQRTVAWFSWIFLVITLGVLAILFFDNVLTIPSLETVMSVIGGN